MSSVNARNIVELRQLLAEKFPGVRMSAERPESMAQRCSTGVPQIDAQLSGGLPRGAMTEIVSPGIASGSMLFLDSLLRESFERGEWLALIDGSNSLDPSALDHESLSRLLWVRCENAREAIKAADMLLHDGTISVVALDLLFNPANQIRKLSSSTWFRLQRILENSSTAFVVLSPEHMISNANARLTLEKRFGLDSIEQRRETLLAQVVATVPGIATRRIVRVA